MKFLLLFTILFYNFLVWSQTRISSQNQHYFASIAALEKPSNISQEWIDANFPNLPIYKVHGEYCVSAIAKVNSQFSKQDLKGDFYLGSQIGNVVTIKI